MSASKSEAPKAYWTL